jgi:hypothetical protein
VVEDVAALEARLRHAGSLDEVTAALRAAVSVPATTPQG